MGAGPSHGVRVRFGALTMLCQNGLSIVALPPGVGTPLARSTASNSASHVPVGSDRRSTLRSSGLEPPQLPHAERVAGRAARLRLRPRERRRRGHRAELRVDAHVRDSRATSTGTGIVLPACAGSAIFATIGASSEVGDVRRVSYSCTRT